MPSLPALWRWRYHIPYIFKTSPLVRFTAGSDRSGLKWHTQLLRETHVGKAIPGGGGGEEGGRMIACEHVTVDVQIHNS